jgi:DNA-binding GntR family transcriptional regulator
MQTKTTAYSRAYHKLREEIFSGELKPGSKLTVSMLSQRYGVGTMPIRAALQELRGEGLIIGQPQRGAMVRPLDAQFVENLFDLRIAVLTLLYRRCVRFITNADLEDIEEVQTRLEAASNRGDFENVRRINYEFHRTIHRIAQNPEAANVIERNWILIDALRAQFGFGDGRVDAMNKNHRLIIAALYERDGAKAFELQRSSSEKAKAELVRLVEEHRTDRRP